MLGAVFPLASFVPVGMPTGTRGCSATQPPHALPYTPRGRTRPLAVNQCGPQWSHADTVCPCATPLKLIRVWHLVSGCHVLQCICTRRSFTCWLPVLHRGHNVFMSFSPRCITPTNLLVRYFFFPNPINAWK